MADPPYQLTARWYGIILRPVKPLRESELLYMSAIVRAESQEAAEDWAEINLIKVLPDMTVDKVWLLPDERIPVAPVR